jgi:prepilin-type N-terminal cleavage/methylation domain-containing protein/prepilin-type processing-associated H-X9-DG protein
MNQRGFTMIEIVVSISILLVLAAIAMPVVNSFSEKGKEAACYANGRQLGLAMSRYSSENEGTINGMGAVIVGTEKTSWMTRIREYFEADAYADIRSKFICPAHPKVVRDNDAHVGWAFNTQFIPVNNTLVRMVAVPNPSRTIYAAEGYRDFDWDAGDGQRTGFTAPTGFVKKNVIATGERVFFPHGGKSVVVFLDGHVETLKAPIPRELWAVQK